MRNKMKPAKKPTEHNRFTVVLEAIQSDFQVFGEKLDLVDGKIDRLVADVEFIKDEVINIKLEISELRKLLSQKADLKRLEELERRVRRIEAAIAKR